MGLNVKTLFVVFLSFFAACGSAVYSPELADKPIASLPIGELPDAGPTIVLGPMVCSSNVQKFDADGTWTSPDPMGTNLHVCDVWLFGSGGCGGCGGRGNGMYGGGASGAGGTTKGPGLDITKLPNTVSVVVGVVCTPCAAVTTNDTPGGIGGKGYDTTFGTLLAARGGHGGYGGTLASGMGANGGAGMWPGQSGAPGGDQDGTNYSYGGQGFSGEGGGGGAGYDGSFHKGGYGGGSAVVGYMPQNALGGQTVGAVGGNGGSISGMGPIPGGGGGGGASGDATHPGGNGGNGGDFSGAGGGGGASANGQPSGVGGQGGKAYAQVNCY